MIRTIRIRGRSVQWNMEDRLMAAHLSPESAVRLRRRELDVIGEPAGPQYELADDASVDGWDRTTWENAGWYLVRPAAHQSGGTAPADIVASVFHDENGEPLLATRRLTVRLRDDLDAEEARRRLETRGLEVLRRLRFAPNLFEVAAPAGTDVLSLAESLSESGECQYAEPQIVRPTGRR